MSRSIEEALADCLERMRADGMSPEEALGLYPGLRDELEPLLALTVEIDSLPTVQAPASLRTYKRPAFRTASARSTLPAREAWWKRWLPLGVPGAGWSAPLARAAVALGLFMAASGGAVVASADSLPDEPLYSVKLALESAELALAPNEQARTNLELKLATKRLKEIEAAAQQGKPEAVARGVELYEERANAAARAASSNDAEEVQEALKNNVEVLTRVQDKVQNPRAIEAIGAAIARAEDRSDGAKEPKDEGQTDKEPKDKEPNEGAKAERQAAVAVTPTPTATIVVEATPEPTMGHEPPGKATGRPEEPGNASQSASQGAGAQDQGQGQSKSQAQGQGQAQGEDPGEGQGQARGQGQGPRVTPTPAAATSTPTIEPSSQSQKPSQTQRGSGQPKAASEGKDEAKNSTKSAQENEDPVSNLWKELRRLIGRP